MRFMMLMIPRVYQGEQGSRVGADFAPDPGAVEEMGRFNDRLVRAGALVAGDGLRPPSTGALVEFGAGKPQVKDIPATGGRQLGGYWIIRADSQADAVRWATQCPAAPGDAIEVRQIFDSDPAPDAAPRAVK
jgi:hypothetical protein